LRFFLPFFQTCSMPSTSVAAAAFLVAGPVHTRAGSSERLIVKNECATDELWIASINGPSSLVNIQPGGTHRYNIPDGMSATRFWPKMFCNSEGQECKIGDSGGPGQECGSHGCAPPVDSKFEATFGNSAGDCHSDASVCDWWDTSSVDGFTLPYKVDVSDSCKGDGYGGADIDCSRLRLSNCPAQSNVQGVGTKDLRLRHPDTGDVVGCYSPCALLTASNWNNPDGHFTPPDSTAGPYCCPTPPVSSEECRAGPADSSEYTQLIHSECPSVYAYAYDDAVGLQVCPATTVYTWTLYCPSGGSPTPPSPPPTPPAPSPSPPPSPPPSPSPSATCNAGDTVSCSLTSSQYQCRGNQCCGDLSTCPSADNSFHSCPSGKNYDCTTR